MINPFFIEKLRNAEVVFGTWNTLNSPISTNLIAQSGLDFQIIDYEHGPFDISASFSQISACKNDHGAITCAPLFRIPSLTEWVCLQLIDQGAYGLVLPHVESEETLNNFIRLTSYPPIGRKGFSPYTPSAEFNMSNLSSKMHSSNKDLARIAIIENVSSLQAIPDLLSLNSIDVFYLGAYDLSVDLGIPGQLNHLDLTDLMVKAIALIKNAGVSVGGYVPKNQQQVDEVLDMGMNFITYGVDSMLLYESYKNIINWRLSNAHQ